MSIKQELQTFHIGDRLKTGLSTKLRTGLAEIFQSFEADYLDDHGFTAPQAKVVRDILDCGTRAKEGHSEAWADRRRRLLRHDWVVYAKTLLGGPAIPTAPLFPTSVS